MTKDQYSVQSPFSDSFTDHIWAWKENRPIYRCPDTGAVFFDRRTVEIEDYQDYYPYLEDFDVRRFRWELAIREKKYRKQLRLMQRYTAGKTLLDVGAGPGYFCRVAEDQGWTAYGMEVSQCAVKHGQAQFAVRYKNLQEIEDLSLDAIVCHHVLEHIGRPVEFIAGLRAKLKQGGLLVIHVPHEQPLTFKARTYFRRLLSNGKNRESFCSLYGNEHLSGFTRDSLKAFIERRGFETHFVRSAGMWMKYYDPFFFKNYLRSGNWVGLGRSFIKHSVESIGTPLGLGDWVIGYFRKA